MCITLHFGFTLYSFKFLNSFFPRPGETPVSYTHLDVYKRQLKVRYRAVLLRLRSTRASSIGVYIFRLTIMRPDLRGQTQYFLNSPFLVINSASVQLIYVDMTLQRVQHIVRTTLTHQEARNGMATHNISLHTVRTVRLL